MVAFVHFTDCSSCFERCDNFSSQFTKPSVLKCTIIVMQCNSSLSLPDESKHQSTVEKIRMKNNLTAKNFAWYQKVNCPEKLMKGFFFNFLRGFQWYKWFFIICLDLWVIYKLQDVKNFGACSDLRATNLTFITIKIDGCFVSSWWSQLAVDFSVKFIIS